MSVNQRVVEVLEAKGLKKSDLARKWGKPAPRIYEQLNSEKDTDSLSLIRSCKHLTGATYNYIIDGVDPKTEEDFWRSKLEGDKGTSAIIEEGADKAQVKMLKTRVKDLEARIRDLEELNTLKDVEITRLKKQVPGVDGNSSSKTG